MSQVNTGGVPAPQQRQPQPPAQAQAQAQAHGPLQAPAVQALSTTAPVPNRHGSGVSIATVIAIVGPLLAGVGGYFVGRADILDRLTKLESSRDVLNASMSDVKTSAGKAIVNEITLRGVEQDLDRLRLDIQKLEDLLTRLP
ncbi:MAG: hypothetical protein AAFR96_07440 [Planctomycetota bacterium]